MKGRSNGARNQTRAGGSVDARWHQKNIARARKKSKIAKKSRRINRARRKKR